MSFLATLFYTFVIELFKKLADKVAEAIAKAKRRRHG